MGQQAYDDLRELVLHHQETFVEQLYDLHRLTRRQQHLEANCGQRAAYNAELQSLVSAHMSFRGVRCSVCPMRRCAFASSIESRGHGCSCFK